MGVLAAAAVAARMQGRVRLGWGGVHPVALDGGPTTPKTKAAEEGEGSRPSVPSPRSGVRLSPVVAAAATTVAAPPTAGNR